MQNHTPIFPVNDNGVEAALVINFNSRDYPLWLEENGFEGLQAGQTYLIIVSMEAPKVHGFTCTKAYYSQEALTREEWLGLAGVCTKDEAPSSPMECVFNTGEELQLKSVRTGEVGGLIAYKNQRTVPIHRA